MPHPIWGDGLWQTWRRSAWPHCDEQQPKEHLPPVQSIQDWLCFWNPNAWTCWYVQAGDGFSIAKKTLFLNSVLCSASITNIFDHRVQLHNIITVTGRWPQLSSPATSGQPKQDTVATPRARFHGHPGTKASTLTKSRWVSFGRCFNAHVSGELAISGCWRGSVRGESCGIATGANDWCQHSSRHARLLRKCSAVYCGGLVFQHWLMTVVFLQLR